MNKRNGEENNLQYIFPTDVIFASGVRDGHEITTRFDVRHGIYDLNGATLLNDGVNFTCYSSGATSVSLLLFDRGSTEPYAKIRIPEKYRIGDVYSIIIFGLNIEEFEYAYSLTGPWEPQKGLLFDEKNYLLDPYARAVTGQSKWGQDNISKGNTKARVVRNDYDWGSSLQPHTPIEDVIIYEMHVRGFTKSETSGAVKKGTFGGVIEKAYYLRALGVTAVELLPVFEFDENMENRVVDGKKLLDYWGYNTISFFAPNTGYTYQVEYNREGTELKDMIRILNQSGIEVYLDVVFNHTAEGNEKGPFLSFKGFDNNIYYMLTPDGKYYNFSGCGNTINCNHPVVQQLIVDCLRYWAINYRVNGFRFDLASILGRSEDGSPMTHPPLIERLANDPILKECKLIAEAWDAGGMYQVGSFNASNRWSEWNDKYRDCIRDYMKGDFWRAPEALQRITGSRDIFGNKNAEALSTVNFITCHDGFTLMDLFSYNTKHNEANGYDNRDGIDDNHSWNCGVEGETDDKKVIDLRMRLIRNSVVTLMLSRGIPMILMGDEIGRTKKGNNNTFCQDNEISWMNWNLVEENEELFNFWRNVISFRKKHPSISRNLEPSATNYPYISTHAADPAITEVTSDDRVCGVMYAGRKKDGEEDIVFLAINVHWEYNKIKLPPLPGGYRWALAINTADSDDYWFYDMPVPIGSDEYEMNYRSIAVFVAICS